MQYNFQNSHQFFVELGCFVAQSMKSLNAESDRYLTSCYADFICDFKATSNQPNSLTFSWSGSTIETASHKNAFCSSS